MVYVCFQRWYIACKYFLWSLDFHTKIGDQFWLSVDVLINPLRPRLSIPCSLKKYDFILSGIQQK
jgi:hypothetical protein